MTSIRPLSVLAHPVVAAGLVVAAIAPATLPRHGTAPDPGGVTVIEKTSYGATSSVAGFAPAAAHAEPADPKAIRQVVETFVWGLTNERADVVWDYATEEEQDGLGTEPAVLAAFRSAYPPLAHARDMVFKEMHWEGDLPFVSFYVRDGLGLQWQAKFGLYLDDAGDWRVVSLDITGAPGELT